MKSEIICKSCTFNRAETTISAQSSMQFYIKSDKLLHIEHPPEVRLVLRTTVLLFMVIYELYSRIFVST